MRTTITTQVLNTLIKVNKERITMYHQAINAMNGISLAPLRLFRCMISESEQYKEQLENTLKEMGQEPDHESESIRDHVLNIGSDRTLNKKQFSLCEVEEVVVQKAYEHALSQRLDQSVARMLYDQHEELKISYGMVKGCTTREAVFH